MTKLFVAMPYGVRKGPLDYERPERTVKIDFDGVWEGILKPAVPTEFETQRADEILHSGLIDRLYIKWLLEADIVLADLTFFNPKHYRRAYELQPDNLYSQVSLAGMSGALGLVTEASDLYEKLRTASQQLVDQGSADHWTYLCLGEASAALGDHEAALAAYESALQRKPPVEHVRSEAEQLEFLLQHNFAAENMRNVLPMLREYITTTK